MNVAEVLPLDFKLELSEGFNKGHTLNVSHCSSKLLIQNRSLYHRTAHMNKHVGSYTTLTVFKSSS